MSGASRKRDLLVVLLSLNSGATDAIGLLLLGGAFTSVMTGNMVLLGVSGAQGNGPLALHAGVAIICFVVGCAVGHRLAGSARPDDPVWPAQISRALAVEFAVLVIYAAFWMVAGGEVSEVGALGLLALNACALGIQSSSVQRFGVPGLSTTYLTGTLTTLVMRLTAGKPLRDVRLSALLLAGLIGGAALGGLLALRAPVVAPLLQLACVGTVLLASRFLTPAPASATSSTATVTG
ncbi:YoaK family protein [Microbispora amethystogenes]|uniref:YoaK family protein n=1 Tax=Microbispora amethystogenes TaxID=1427754 RepID=UPI0034052648